MRIYAVNDSDLFMDNKCYHFIINTLEIGFWKIINICPLYVHTSFDRKTEKSIINCEGCPGSRDSSPLLHIYTFIGPLKSFLIDSSSMP